MIPSNTTWKALSDNIRNSLLEFIEKSMFKTDKKISFGENGTVISTREGIRVQYGDGHNAFIYSEPSETLLKIAEALGA